MSQVISVVSGKGGVGKSTVCTYMADAAVKSGAKVLIIEFDFGLRGLDIMLGVENSVVYDAGDVISGDVDLSSAAVNCSEGIYLLAAASKPCESCFHDVEKLLKSASQQYDFVFIDLPAGIGTLNLDICNVSDVVTVVTTPDPVCVRDAGRLVQMLTRSDHCRLLINRVDLRKKNNPIQDFDSILDDVGVPLLGVIPDDLSVKQLSFKGELVSNDSLVKKVFERVIMRLSGKTAHLLVG